LGEKIYGFEGFNFASVNPATDGPFLLDTVSAHRIEPGFYYPLTELSQLGLSSGFERSVFAGPISSAEVQRQLLQLANVQEIAANLGNLLKRTEPGAGGALAKLLFGGIGGLAFGDSQEIDRLVRAYVETRNLAGKYLGKEDEYKAAVSTNWTTRLRIGGLALAVGSGWTPFNIVLKVAGAIALAPILRLVEGFYDDDREFLRDFAVQRVGRDLPASTFEETLVRSTLLGTALRTPNLPEAKQIPLVEVVVGDDIDGFSEAMVSNGQSWFFDTDRYLRDRANQSGRQLEIGQLHKQFWGFARDAAGANQVLLASVAGQQEPQ
jgi:hypothetical protein